jgi:CysZ protein
MAAGSGRMRRWFGEFARGFVSLRHGFAFWRVRPGLMALGLVPAVIVAAVFAVLVVVLAINLETITSWMTPFAANWWEWARVAIRVTIGVATLAGALVLVGFAFTAVTLLVGDPVYEKIWRGVEEHAGGLPPVREPGFWHSLGDAARLVLQGVVSGLVIWILGFIPVLGLLAPALGFLVASRLVALELTARPLEARGLDRRERVRMLRSRNPRLLGFGVAVHLCYLVPGGQIAVMPAAVVTATLLAREAHASGA